ncbi:MAG: hypothetical protein NVS9B15_16200 [Acidobacteriaceae bacterium]
MSRVARLPWWVDAVVVLCALLMIMGAVIAVFRPAMLVGHAGGMNGAVKVYAGYLFSRNLMIGVVLLAALFTGARKALGAVMLLAGGVQILDAAMDALEHRWALVPGVLILGLLLVAGARGAYAESQG